MSATERFDVVVVGSANLDLVVRSPRIPDPGETLIGDAYDEYPGGKGLNQAVAAARSGARVAFVGALGDDGAGTRLRAVATDDGIDTASTPTVAAPTGRALITVSEDGENTIVVVPGANAAVTANTNRSRQSGSPAMISPIGTWTEQARSIERAFNWPPTHFCQTG